MDRCASPPGLCAAPLPLTTPLLPPHAQVPGGPGPHVNTRELGLLERAAECLPGPAEAPFPDLGSCQGPERSLGLVISECVLKDICTYIGEAPLLSGEGGMWRRQTS